MCLTHQTIDPESVDSFAERLLGLFNGGALSLMISIGHRTGLFDTMTDLDPATSDEIAAAAGLDERYVREWLAALVSGRIISFDPTTRRYLLPAEHAELLCRQASPDNLAVVAQYLPVLATVEDDIVDCFRRGGGVPYSAFARFHEVMAEDSAQTVVSALEEHILPLVPGLIDRLRDGIEVLDVGCGRGRALLRLAQLAPASRFVGYDLSTEAITCATRDARALGLDNVRFEARDLSTFAEPSRYRMVTAFDAIHDQADPAAVLEGIARSLRPDGVFLMQDIAGSSHLEHNLDNPLAPLFYTISCMHCMTVSLAQGGAGLGTMWGEELAASMLAEAGFDDVSVHRLEHDIQNIYFVARPDRPAA
jgi:2-polyprenyl-3-methyl-5-hydroxy-6-metoxy-1,4-benzoquinol methylase